MLLNLDPPAGPDDYVHRVGRTGRAGRSGTGVTLVLPAQQRDVGALATHLGHGEAFDGSGMEQADTAAASANAGSRRRRRAPARRGR